jgi:hypothetical protein
MNLPFFLWEWKSFLFFEAIDKKLKEELVDFESIHKDYKIIISLNY